MHTAFTSLTHTCDGLEVANRDQVPAVRREEGSRGEAKTKSLRCRGHLRSSAQELRALPIVSIAVPSSGDNLLGPQL